MVKVQSSSRSTEKNPTIEILSGLQSVSTQNNEDLKNNLATGEAKENVIHKDS